jgi:hypothetical protein
MNDSLKPLTILQLQQALRETDAEADLLWQVCELSIPVRDLETLYTTIIDLTARKALRVEIITALTEKISELD